MVGYWKHWMSYLKEIELESVHRKEEDALYVSLKKGRLMLSTDLTIYSWDDLYKNFVWGFEKLHFDQLQGNQALLLGMGLGAVPYILERQFDKTFEFTAVEIDPEIVRLAKKWSLPRLKNPPTVYCSDATEFIYQLHRVYDLIIVDICREDYIPTGCESKAFLSQLKQLAGDSGVIMYNRFYSTYKDHFKTDRFYKGIFKTVFPKSGLIDQNGTCMLVNDVNFFSISPP